MITCVKYDKRGKRHESKIMPQVDMILENDYDLGEFKVISIKGDEMVLENLSDSPKCFYRVAKICEAWKYIIKD